MNPLAGCFLVIEGEGMRARLVRSLRMRDHFPRGPVAASRASTRRLSLLPMMQMVRAIFSGPAEHFVAYAIVAAITIAGYGSGQGGQRTIAALCVYAGALEYIRHFSPGRHPSIAKIRWLGARSALRRAGRSAPFTSLSQQPP
jgi:hypothetical protein